MKELTAALIALAEANVPVDLQELLTHGNPVRGIAPGALAKAIAAVDQQRAVERRLACKHHNRRGSGMLASSGESSWKWHCPDCGASGEHSTPPRILTQEEIDAAPILIG